MTALIIFLNAAFAAIVVVGMVALHGWAIVKDARATGDRVPSLTFLQLRPRPRPAAERWRRELDPAAR